MSSPETPVDPAGATGSGDLADLEERLLLERPALTQAEVAEQAGLPLEVAQKIRRLLGFAQADPDERAFTTGDVRAYGMTRDLIDLGVLSEERQEALIRTWGRSFARLAEWQVGLLADIATEAGITEPDDLLDLADQVIPKVEALQSFVWRRHLVNASARLLADVGAEAGGSELAVCFVDIVGYTSRSRTLSDRELVAWLEAFETASLDIVVEHNGRIIKNIGDELLIVADSAADAAAIAVELTRRGADPDDPFPDVRAGVAHGEVVTRLGDVFGPVVNIAARLTSIARPGTVLVDQGMYAALTGLSGDDEDSSPRSDDSPYRFRRLRRVSVKGYSRLKAWALSPA
ncbi:adenylate/guanylate cyclase domain-containing protein [Nocardioides humilatus]|uniref:Adenylate/guanylate cyclase domain-containing protein n=1 Tax=Nocardioides humilatus TaxID=2607660 RepID=A0A5B1LMP6_9ACTN|nr:adenylate/guanylate cyclase domain-containing protein [Nocardioides humilatus]KAA1421952.1 adenylate/guanylate cyclase domain-containing protein [Nocardioides humilatus]